MSNMQICVVSRGHPARQPDGWPLSVLRSKKFKVGHYVQTLQPSSFIPVMLMGTVDFSHFMPLSVGVTRSAQSDMLACFFTHF